MARDADGNTAVAVALATAAGLLAALNAGADVGAKNMAGEKPLWACKSP